MTTITYKHPTGDTIICHGLAYSGQPGYFTGPLGDTDTTETEWTVDPIRPIGADHATPADRGCGIHTFELQVERRFTSEQEARTFARNLSAALPRKGVSLTEADTVNAKLTTYSTAVLQKLITSRVGISLDIYFLFQTSVPVITNIPEPPEE
ncbi:MAG: hypothetical protein PHI93_10910 [Kiritimatiellae bacterium]|nr:hypothetical protein [Kiritimatiellia bacterium]